MTRARRGLRAGGAVRRRDLARVRRSRDVRRSERAASRAAAGMLVAMKGVYPRRGDRAAAGRHCACRRRRRAARARARCASATSSCMRGRAHDAHPRGRQPEGRRRQDDDRGQPRREPRRDASAACCWSISIRRATRPWAAARQARARRTPSTTCCSASERSPTCASRRRPAASTSCPPNRELAGAEVELVDLPERETRLKDALAEALRQMRARSRGRRRLRLHPDRLPAVAVAAHGERPVRRRLGADPDAVRVLRARRACPTSCRRSRRCARTSIRGSRSKACCARCTTRATRSRRTSPPSSSSISATRSTAR